MTYRGVFHNRIMQLPLTNLALEDLFLDGTREKETVEVTRLLLPISPDTRLSCFGRQYVRSYVGRWIDRLVGTYVYMICIYKSIWTSEQEMERTKKASKMKGYRKTIKNERQTYLGHPWLDSTPNQR